MATLGPVGVHLPISFTRTPPAESQREAVRRLERAGYRTVWTNEVVGGKDALVQLAVLLAATERLTFGTGIANVWAREPQTLHAGAAFLAEAYPGRLVLGVGVGYPQQAEATGRDFGSPLATMRDYVGRMDAETWPPAPEADYPRILGANGPRMLALAGEIADGAYPANLPPSFTAEARSVLGPGKLLVVGLAVAPDPDADRAKAAAVERVSATLNLPTFSNALRRLGFDLDDVAGIADAIVAHGGPDAIAAKVREHLAAGADHVLLMPPTTDDFRADVEVLERLAPAFGGLG
ncbi:TIGR03620 family F420-dependent LLM class oxidoreductase [Amycolatopsis mongoliensis]|uniref:TIGR03620 family F420-dependent LLM class oxidoreductase n=1 Tax=Amycolatopsis mongoliensis TaxID=715475 RepID=A0A9Y2JLI4_9PSEU|nr:TIGR03620 family F420-dependent LLM class oxidoreductase [Amycolatopsis sp. 4-36]WIX99043.1 TIGR03620 family F420-dependent LLM class oxidoreductase [Amycolatopsis sp. 4-36]